MQLITNLMVRLQNTELKCKNSTRYWEAYEPELQVQKIPQAGSDVQKERPKKLSLIFFPSFLFLLGVKIESENLTASGFCDVGGICSHGIFEVLCLIQEGYSFVLFLLDFLFFLRGGRRGCVRRIGSALDVLIYHWNTLSSALGMYDLKPIDSCHHHCLYPRFYSVTLPLPAMSGSGVQTDPLWELVLVAFQNVPKMSQMTFDIWMGF